MQPDTLQPRGTRCGPQETGRDLLDPQVFQATLLGSIADPVTVTLHPGEMNHMANLQFCLQVSWGVCWMGVVCSLQYLFLRH